MSPPQTSEENLRRWLSLLKRPDRLGETKHLRSLLKVHGRVPGNDSPIEVGRAAAELFRYTIEGLEPAPEAPREEWLPFHVLKTCFLEGATRWQAANKLGLSERQMSRERTRAIRLLRALLEAPVPESATGPRSRLEPIPAILGFMQRPAMSRLLDDALTNRRFVSVHGPAGVGKTTLVAELVAERSERVPTFWYRFRPGLNHSVQSLLFELGEYLRSRRHPELASYITQALPTPDPGLGARLAIKLLAGSAHLLVFDDYHVVGGDRAIAGLLEEAVSRLPDLRVVTIGRHRGTDEDMKASVPILPLKLSETEAFLVNLGLDVRAEVTRMIHTWTEGVPHLVKLAASWLKTATPKEIERGAEAFEALEEVQEFLLENITEVLGPNERGILEAASIFRDRFTDDALAFVSERTRGEVHDTSRRLVRAYVATRSRGGDVAFFHTTVREYVYARLGKERRRQLHQRAAAWYQRQGEGEAATYQERACGGSD